MNSNITGFPIRRRFQQQSSDIFHLVQISPQLDEISSPPDSSRNTLNNIYAFTSKDASIQTDSQNPFQKQIPESHSQIPLPKHSDHLPSITPIPNTKNYTSNTQRKQAKKYSSERALKAENKHVQNSKKMSSKKPGGTKFLSCKADTPKVPAKAKRGVMAPLKSITTSTNPSENPTPAEASTLCRRGCTPGPAKARLEAAGKVFGSGEVDALCDRFRATRIFDLKHGSAPPWATSEDSCPAPPRSNPRYRAAHPTDPRDPDEPTIREHEHDEHYNNHASQPSNRFRATRLFDLKHGCAAPWATLEDASPRARKAFQ